MRLASRVRNWLRKLGSTEDGAEASSLPLRQGSGSSKEHAREQVPRGSLQPLPEDSSQTTQPSPQVPVAAASIQQEPPTSPAPKPQAQRASQQGSSNGPNGKSMLDTRDFFAEAVHAEANRYTINEVIGKGSYGVVCSAVDNFTGEKVAIKKITNVFEHVSDATRIVREIKLLRLLKHPDIVDIKHIMLPPSPKDFKDIYVVFELLDTDLHQVIKANDDLTPEHHQFFLYQMLRGLKYIHSAKVFHRDLKPKNILANSDCKLKICDFGLARPAFTDAPTTVFWTDYVATRWYRAPELCGSFFARYSPAIDIWSVGCIFAEVLGGRPLFPGRNVVHQLELITDLLGTPPPEVVAKVRNEKARRFLATMRPKPGVSFEQHFPRADPLALRLLRRLLAFDPAERPTAEEALADPYFSGLHSATREPSAQPLSRLAFEFDRRKLSLEDVRELIYREILEYHPSMLHAHLAGGARPHFHYPSALESFKRQFAHLEAGGAPLVRGQTGGPRIFPSASLPKEWVAEFQAEAAKYLPPAQPASPAPPTAPSAPPAGPIAAAATTLQRSQYPAAAGKGLGGGAAVMSHHLEEGDGPDGVGSSGLSAVTTPPPPQIFPPRGNSSGVGAGAAHGTAVTAAEAAAALMAAAASSSSRSHHQHPHHHHHPHSRQQQQVHQRQRQQRVSEISGCMGGVYGDEGATPQGMNVVVYDRMEICRSAGGYGDEEVEVELVEDVVVEGEERQRQHGRERERERGRTARLSSATGRRSSGGLLPELPVAAWCAGGGSVSGGASASNAAPGPEAVPYHTSRHSGQPSSYQQQQHLQQQNLQQQQQQQQWIAATVLSYGAPDGRCDGGPGGPAAVAPVAGSGPTGGLVYCRAPAGPVGTLRADSG